jgi:hypothetical protein
VSNGEITPYRAPGAIKVEPSKPMFGLLRIPRSHGCSPPGVFARFWLWITFRGLEPSHTLWRCRECSTVWLWHTPAGSIDKKWSERNEDAWINAGGAR